MKKVLLPTDFSDNSYNAIAYAVQLLKNEACRFYVLNTYTPVIYDNEYILYNATQPSLEEVYKTNSVKGLGKILTRINNDFPNSKHQFEQLSSFNMLVDEIKEQVKDKEIDLVVMGTKGATGADQILFGTNTVHTIKKTTCPLLAIPSGFKYQPIRNILFPTDYDITYSNKLIVLLKELARSNAANINILNVYLGATLSDQQEASKKILAALFKEIPHQFYTIENDTVAEGVYEFQEKNPTDLLAMINNKHSFFENLLFTQVVNKIGFHTKVPFLVIPSGKYTS